MTATVDTQSRAERRLRAAAIVFAVGSVIHNGDHFRRGLSSVTTELQAAGWLAMALSALVVWLVLTHHRLAPMVAAYLGLALAIGFTAAHWLPHWSALSDSFVDEHVSTFSRAASLLEIAGALLLSAAGFASDLSRR